MDGGTHADPTIPMVMFAFGFIVSVFAGMILALPVALPVILITEQLEEGRWWIFAIAGLLLGLFVLFVLSAIIAEVMNFELVIVVMATSTFASIAYWFVAWRLFTHQPSRAPDLETFE